MEKNDSQHGGKLQCPYVQSHWVRAKRMQVHLMKCERQHPDMKLRKCPYNYAHHVKEEEYSEHTQNCVDRHLGVVDDVEPATHHIQSVRDSQTPSTSGTNVDRVDPAESSEPMATALDEENWDDMDEAPYNPAKYCKENKIIRKARMMTKAARAEFYMKEAKRHAKLEEEEKSKKENTNTNFNP